MEPKLQRLAIAKVCGWEGCSDAKCDYRKAQHLHKGGVVAFPESYSIPRYPDYPNDLNACHEMEKEVLALGLWDSYWSKLIQLLPRNDTPTSYAGRATAAQRSEAFLNYLGLWKP